MYILIQLSQHNIVTIDTVKEYLPISIFIALGTAIISLRLTKRLEKLSNAEKQRK